MTTRATVEAAGDGGLVRIVVTGEIDLSNAGAVERGIFAGVSNEATNVSIDLSGVDYLDSAGLRVVYALATRLELLQIDLAVVAPVDSAARHVIELAGLASVLRLLPEG